MALVKCRECGKEISNNASSCPYCGYKNRKNNLKLIIIALIILVVILLFGISILYIKYKLDNDNYDDGYNFNLNNNTNNNINESSDINNSYISSSDALSIVLKDLNINKNDIYDLSNELEYKFGKTVYDIDFNYNRFEYEYYVDAITGEIVKSFKEYD